MTELSCGDVLNNTELMAIFSCSSQGGMRRSLKTSSLVLVSNHVKSIYNDRWELDVFHYTGTGTVGNQSLGFSQNKTLAESHENKVSVHLFEVFEEKSYVYIGQVKLVGLPYFETQTDMEESPRQVCVFPLGLLNGEAAILPAEHVNKNYSHTSKKINKLSDDQVRRRAEHARVHSGVRKVSSKQYYRDPWVAENAKRVADGFCQLCNKKAPFTNTKGDPYLETHHIIWVSKGGDDTVKNTVALCPNCHRKMHVVNDPKDVETLQNRR